MQRVAELQLGSAMAESGWAYSGANSCDASSVPGVLLACVPEAAAKCVLPTCLPTCLGPLDATAPETEGRRR